MSAITIRQMAVRVLHLLDGSEVAPGGDLAPQMRKAARRLPRAERQAALRLAQAHDRAADPKLLLQIDETQVAADYDHLVHLLNRPSRWRALGQSLGGAVLVSLVLMGGVALWAMTHGA